MIALSILAVIASLIGLSKCIDALNEKKEQKPTEKNYDDSFQIIDYVICIFLSQGAKLFRHIQYLENTILKNTILKKYNIKKHEKFNTEH